MAPTWGDAKAMCQACDERDVTITFCHQRRFERPFKKAKSLVREGAIGRLVRGGGRVSESARLGHALVRYVILLQ